MHHFSFIVIIQENCYMIILHTSHSGFEVKSLHIRNKIMWRKLCKIFDKPLFLSAVFRIASAIFPMIKLLLVCGSSVVWSSMYHGKTSRNKLITFLTISPLAFCSSCKDMGKVSPCIIILVYCIHLPVDKHASPLSPSQLQISLV